MWGNDQNIKGILEVLALALALNPKYRRYHFNTEHRGVSHEHFSR
jgi:hypothetical protein